MLPRRLQQFVRKLMLLVQGQFVVGLGSSGGKGSGKEWFYELEVVRSDRLVSFAPPQLWTVIAPSSTWRDHRDLR